MWPTWRTTQFAKSRLNGDVTTVAGSPQQFGFADGTGSAARFRSPTGIAVDSLGNLYVSDNFGPSVRKVTPAGVVTTLGGASWQTGNADGVGSDARFNSPMGVALDNAGNLYIADSGNSTIRLAGPANPSVSFTTAGLINGHMMLTGSALPGSTVTILASSSLGIDFTGIATVTTNPVGFYRFEDTDTGSFSSRFYNASISDDQSPATLRPEGAEPKSSLGVCLDTTPRCLLDYGCFHTRLIRRSGCGLSSGAALTDWKIRSRRDF